jgi:hypothetical protein
MMISRTELGLRTKVYRKKTHTQQYIHWRSNHPKNVLLGTLKGLIHRAHYFCDVEEDLKEELDLLKEVFIINGYPEKLVIETICKSWAVEMKKKMQRNLKQTDTKKKEDGEYFDILHAPYVRDFSEALQRSLRRLNIGYVVKTRKTIESRLHRTKPPISVIDHKDVVYGVRCKDCDLYYIGETSQHLDDRLCQHKREVKKGAETNAFFVHISNNNDHRIDWESPIIIDREPHWQSRKLKESLYISAIDPSNDLQDILNLEKGLKTDSCWHVFNQEIKEALKKKRIVQQKKKRSPGET